MTFDNTATFLAKGTEVLVRTTNGGEATGKLLRDYIPSYLVDMEINGASVVIPGWRIKSVTVASPANDGLEIVERIGEFEFSRKELEQLFSRVSSEKNWKLPVDAVVTFTSVRERIGMHVAVRFFTGSVPTLEVMRLERHCSIYRVMAAGYYAAVGA